MSVSTAIGMVSESLRNLLVTEMRLVPTVDVTVLAPDEGHTDRCINLFLYKVQENPALKDVTWQVKMNDPTKLVLPPLSLNLFYLMTPYATNDLQTGNATAHEILGEAMRVFYENAIVPNEYLVEGLKDAREQIKIILNSLDLDELSKVWSTFTKPFRLSVLYEVSVVQLDMLPEKEKAMAKPVRKIKIPEVSVPYRPPLVEKIEPISGPPGTVITVYGQNLSGWVAYVTLMRRLILDAMDLTNDIFQVTIPGDLPLGFYEIRIDISHLYRRTFIFEVTTST